MKKIVCIILAIFIMGCVGAQEILTASNYFKSVSEYYGTLKDYEADVAISAGKEKMTGTVSYKKPNLLRIDFTDPESQVIVFNGDMLTIYLPGSDAAMIQSLEKNTDPGMSGASLATPQGLYLLSRYYYVSYETSQAPVPLEEGSDEMVVKLILSRKTAAEGFKRIDIAISKDTKLIRKIEAVQASNNEHFVFDFFTYRLNQNIPDERFIYDAPSSANNYNNFLFTE